MSTRKRQRTHHIREARRREKIVALIKRGKITKVEASRRLNLSAKTIYRIHKNYMEGGFEALISKKRPGMRSNRRYNDELRGRVKNFLLKYQGHQPYGPKVMAEKLLKERKIKLSKETLRLWMLEWKMWRRQRRKRTKRT